MSAILMPIRQHWRAFLIALQFFTRIPITIKDFDTAELNQSVPFFPLVGIVIGLAGAAVYSLCDQALPLSLSIILSMISTLLLTGAFHEDGLADMTDGFGGGWEKSQVLSIMVDSRLGSYGVIALIMALLTKHQSLVSLSHTYIPISLVAGHAISRLFAVLTMHQLEYVKSTGKSKPLATKVTQSQLIIALLFGITPVLFLPAYCWLALLPSWLAWRWLLRLMQRKIGGYTGDCLGSIQQVTEVTFYIGLIACFELNIYFSI